MKKIKTIYIFLCLVPIVAYTQVILDETFEYNDFINTSNWITTGTVTSPNTGRTIDVNPILSYTSDGNTYILSERGKTLTNDYKSETTNYLSGRSFTSEAISETSSLNKVYISFLYKVKSQGGTQSEIIGITDALNNTTGVKLWYGKGATTTTFKLGITKNSGSSAAIQWYNPSVALDANATHLIVLKYDFSTATASFIVNPSLNSTAEPAANAFDDGTVNLVTTSKTSLSHLLMRGNGSNASYFYMGGLRVSQSWADAVAIQQVLPRLNTPTIVDATNISATSFDASWTTVENAMGYDVNVYWGSNLFVKKTINGQSSSSLQIIDLVPDVTYTYQVVAKGDLNSYSNSQPSDASTPFRLLIPTASRKGPKIILKLDDLQSKGGTCLALPVLDFLKNKEVKAGFGAIAIKFDAGANAILKPYFELKDKKGNQLFELWHHGLEHVTDEFSGTDYTYQKSHFDQATQLMKNWLGIQMHTFGTPYNSSDATTNTVISEDPEYKVFLLGSTSPSSSTGIINLTKRVNMESATGDPSFSYFTTNYYAKKDSYSEYMILQGHPNQWTEAEIAEVNQIIQFLATEGCEFVLPYEYYLSLSLLAPSNLQISKVEPNRIKLVWDDNSNNEYNFRIENSADGENWTELAALTQNSTEYILPENQMLEPMQYRVCASSGINSDYSNIVQSNALINGISKTTDNNGFKIYPVPSKDKIYISYTSENEKWISCDLINASGVVFKTKLNDKLTNNKSIEMDISKLQNGIYFLKLQTDSKAYLKKIIIE